MPEENHTPQTRHKPAHKYHFPKTMRAKELYRKQAEKEKRKHRHNHSKGMTHDFSDAKKWSKVFDDPKRDDWPKAYSYN